MLLALAKILLMNVYILFIAYRNYDNLFHMYMYYVYTMVVHSGGPCTGCQLAACVLTMIGYLRTLFTPQGMHVHVYIAGFR